MNGKRQKTSDQQLLLAFAREGRSESPMACEEGTVPVAANLSTESPTSNDRLMERICDPLNLECAMARVIANGGAPDVDGMTVKELEKYFERHRDRIIGELRSYLIGWRGYFGFCQTPSVLRELDSWIHRRLRSYAWKQWKTGQRRFQELRKLGVGKDLAAQTAGSRKGIWHTSRSPALSFALPGRVLAERGVPLLLEPPEMKV